jgi:hypothetical protein
VARFNALRPGEEYAISPLGNWLVRATTFPRTGLQVWSFDQNTFIGNVDIPGSTTEPRVVGFVGPDTVMVRTDSERNTTLEIYDVRQKTRTFRQNVARLNDGRGVALAFSGDGRLMAIFTRLDEKPTIAMLDLTTGRAARNDISVTSLDSRWTSNPTGMVFSPDNSRLAAIWEEAANALAVTYSTGRSEAVPREHIYPSTPARGPRDYRGSSLLWIADPANNEGRWLLYGQVWVDPVTGYVSGQHSDGEPVTAFPASMEHVLTVERDPASGGLNVINRHVRTRTR